MSLSITKLAGINISSIETGELATVYILFFSCDLALFLLFFRNKNINVAKINVPVPINHKYDLSFDPRVITGAMAGLFFLLFELIKIEIGFVETTLYVFVFRSKKENEMEGIV